MSSDTYNLSDLPVEEVVVADVRIYNNATTARARAAYDKVNQAWDALLAARVLVQDLRLLDADASVRALARAAATAASWDLVALSSPAAAAGDSK